MNDGPEIYRLDIAADGPAPETFRNAVVAIGSFDGVHRGHQALISAAGALAAEIGSTAMVVTFEPHPRTVLRPEAPLFRLSQPSAKRALLGIAGATGIVEVVFDRTLAGLSPEDFVERVLVQRLAVRGVVIGEGFRFGQRRAGDAELLRSLGAANGFRVTTLPIVADAAGEIVSSGRIREALQRGDVPAANAALGFRWFVTGAVIHGDHRGRELGYPTANIVMPASTGLRHGVVAVSAHWEGGDAISGVASFGHRPMFGGGESLLEVHLFDRSDDLYGRELAVSFLAWLRAQENFESLDALIRQMDADSVAARAIAAAAGEGSMIDRALMAAT